MKCFYPNFPYKFSLISNHREKGENYAESLGSETVLISEEHLNPLRESTVTLGMMKSTAIIGSKYEDPTLLFSLNSFPSIRQLSRWQFNLRVHRLGASGHEKSFIDGRLPDLFDSADVMNMNASIQFSEQYYLSWEYSNRSSAIDAPPQSNMLAIILRSRQHFDSWFLLEMVEIIESWLPSESLIIHVEVSSLLMSLIGIFDRHLIFTAKSNSICDTAAIYTRPDKTIIDCFLFNETEEGASYGSRIYQDIFEGQNNISFDASHWELR